MRETSPSSASKEGSYKRGNEITSRTFWRKASLSAHDDNVQFQDSQLQNAEQSQESIFTQGSFFVHIQFHAKGLRDYCSIKLIQFYILKSIVYNKNW